VASQAVFPEIHTARELWRCILIGNLLRHGPEAQAKGQRGAAIPGTMKRQFGMIHSGQDSALPSNK